MRTWHIGVIPTVAALLALSGCQGGGVPSGSSDTPDDAENSQQVSAGSISLTVPDTWEDASSTLADDRWTTVWSDSASSPTAQVRVAERLDGAPYADSGADDLAYDSEMRGAYGPEFEVVESEEATVEGSEDAYEVEFSYVGADGSAYEGRWWVFVDPTSNTLAAVELVGSDLDPELIDQVHGSLTVAPPA